MVVEATAKNAKDKIRAIKKHGGQSAEIERRSSSKEKKKRSTSKEKEGGNDDQIMTRVSRRGANTT